MWFVFTDVVVPPFDFPLDPLDRAHRVSCLVDTTDDMREYWDDVRQTMAIRHKCESKKIKSLIEPDFNICIFL